MNHDEMADLVAHGAVVIGPGDTLIVAMHRTLTMEEYGRIVGRVRDALPDINVQLLGDAVAMAVYRRDLLDIPAMPLTGATVQFGPITNPPGVADKPAPTGDVVWSTYIPAERCSVYQDGQHRCECRNNAEQYNWRICVRCGVSVRMAFDSRYVDHNGLYSCRPEVGGEHEVSS